VHTEGNAYEELLRDREIRQLSTPSSPSEATCGVQPASSGKEQYLENKRRVAEERKAQKRAEKLSAEAEKIEKELEEIAVQMEGEAAFDYVLLAELDNKKNALEERLLEIYEEIGV
jgi:predicted DsbA family dithiol-disulfide isomerase